LGTPKLFDLGGSERFEFLTGLAGDHGNPGRGIVEHGGAVGFAEQDHSGGTADLAGRPGIPDHLPVGWHGLGAGWLAT